MFIACVVFSLHFFQNRPYLLLQNMGQHIQIVSIQRIQSRATPTCCCTNIAAQTYSFNPTRRQQNSRICRCSAWASAFRSSQSSALKAEPRLPVAAQTNSFNPTHQQQNCLHLSLQGMGQHIQIVSIQRI